MAKLTWIEKIFLIEQLRRSKVEQAKVKEEEPENFHDTYSLVDFEGSSEEPSYFYYTEVKNGIK